MAVSKTAKTQPKPKRKSNVLVKWLARAAALFFFVATVSYLDSIKVRPIIALQ